MKQRAVWGHEAEFGSLNTALTSRLRYHPCTTMPAGISIHTKLFGDAIKKYYDTFPAVTVKAIQIDPPRKGLKTMRDELLGIEVADEDYDAHGIPTLERVGLKALHMGSPMEDPNERFDSPAAARAELQQAFGDRLISLVNWGDPTTDEALSRFCSQGLAAHRVVKWHDKLVVDLEGLLDYEVRPGFARYGAKLTMDENFRPLTIERSGRTYTPQHAQWELAKLWFRAAVALDVTVRDHAVTCHLMVSNAGVIATRKMLSPDHPLRRLLLPFQYRTPTINRDGLLTLVGERAVFHRLFGLTWDSLKRLYANATRSFRFLTFDQDLYRRGMREVTNSVYHTDGMAFWKLITSFVDDYVASTRATWTAQDMSEIKDWDAQLHAILPGDIPSATDDRDGTLANLRTLASYFIFNATGYHEQVGGGIADYLADHRFASPVVWDRDNFDDALPGRNTMYQGYMLGVLTNLKMPRISDDVAWLFRDATARATVEKFTRSVRKFDSEIAAKNERRPQPCYTFAPRYIELSVSL